MVGYSKLLRVVRGFGCYHRSLLRKCDAGGRGGGELGALPVAQDFFGPPGPGPGISPFQVPGPRAGPFQVQVPQILNRILRLPNY